MATPSIWFGVTKHLFTGPSSFYDRLSGQDGYGTSLKFAAFSCGLLAAQVAVVIGIVGALGDPVVGLAVGAGLGAAMFVYGFLLYMGEAVTAHGILYAMGVRGLPRTMEAFAYPTAVRTTFSLIPVVNLVLGLCGLHLQHVGLKKLHGVSSAKATIAVLGVFVVWFVFIAGVVVLAAVLGTFILGLGSAA